MSWSRESITIQNVCSSRKRSLKYKLGMNGAMPNDNKRKLLIAWAHDDKCTTRCRECICLCCVLHTPTIASYRCECMCQWMKFKRKMKKKTNLSYAEWVALFEWLCICHVALYQSQSELITRKKVDLNCNAHKSVNRNRYTIFSSSPTSSRWRYVDFGVVSMMETIDRKRCNWWDRQTSCVEWCITILPRKSPNDSRETNVHSDLVGGHIRND